MCGRYRVEKDLADLVNHFGELAQHRPFTPRFNLARKQDAPVVHLEDGKATLEMMRWGLVPSWSRDGKSATRCINARSETAADRPAFRDALMHRRCLVPAHGFYEWTATALGKQPWHFHRKGDALMCFAGLWESWTPKDEPGCTPLHTFTIMTTAPSAFAARWHDRMPVILPEPSWDAWLAPDAKREALEPLLVPYAADDLEAWPVTPRMNSPRFESPECVERVVVDGGLEGSAAG